jgi:hypothetical protein
MTTKNKKFDVGIQLQNISIVVSAKNKTEARKKALDRLSKKNPLSLINRTWPDNRKDIYVDEI